MIPEISCLIFFSKLHQRFSNEISCFVYFQYSSSVRVYKYVCMCEYQSFHENTGKKFILQDIRFGSALKHLVPLYLIQIPCTSI